MLFNFCLFRLRRRPVIRRLLLLLAVVVRLPHVVASSVACSPCVVGYRPLAQQHRRQHCHCVLIRPLPSLVARHALHRLLLPQPTAIVNRPLRSSSFFVHHLLSFSSSPVRCLSLLVVGAREGRGVDAAGALLVPKIRPTKARSMTMACCLCPRPRGGGGSVGRSLCPLS